MFHSNVPLPLRKAKKGEINIFQYFSQKQIQEFKEAFGIMDTDKDGIITASDLKVCAMPFPQKWVEITEAE